MERRFLPLTLALNVYPLLGHGTTRNKINNTLTLCCCCEKYLFQKVGMEGGTLITSFTTMKQSQIMKKDEAFAKVKTVILNNKTIALYLEGGESPT